MKGKSEWQQELVSGLLQIVFALPVTLMFFGFLLFPFQIFIYLYKGSWSEMSICMLDNLCSKLDYWENWAGIGKILKFVFSQHIFFSGVLLMTVSIFFLAILFLVVYIVNGIKIGRPKS